MDFKRGLGPLMPRRDRGMATHVAWIARDFGRPDLAPFSTAELEDLARILEPLEVEAGQKILSPGQPADAAYIVQHGEVELALRRGARRLIVGIQRPGGVFGDVPLLCEMPFPFAAVARTRTNLLRLPRESLTDLLARHPAIALRWLSSVVKRLEQANRRIVELTVGDLRARTLALLADELVREEAPAQVALTQGEIAALLGATRQSVNQVLGGLAEEGLLVKQYGSIEIVDAEAVLRLGRAGTAPGVC
jgi:CRP-like cAMP-binding protein